MARSSDCKRWRPGLLTLGLWTALCAGLVQPSGGADYYLARSNHPPQDDPTLAPGKIYDGSSADRVDDFLRRVPAHSTIRFGSHTFETRGVWDNWLVNLDKGFRLKEGWTLIGAGTNSLTGSVFKLVDLPIDDSGYYNFNTVFGTGGVGGYSGNRPWTHRPNINHLTIRDLQIDCNYHGLVKIKGSRAFQVAAIQALGNRGMMISNVLVRNAASRKLDPQGQEFECFQVYLYNPWATDRPGDYHLERIAITDFQGGYTSGICINGNATGVLQNCTVDLQSDKAQHYALNFAAGLNRFTISNNHLLNATRAINNDTGPLCRDVTLIHNRITNCYTGMLLANSIGAQVLSNTFSLLGRGAGVTIRYHPTLDHVKSTACTIRGNTFSGPDGEGISLAYQNEFDPADLTLYWSSNNIVQDNVIFAPLENKIPPQSIAPNTVRPGNRRHLANHPACTSTRQPGNLAAIGFPSDIGPSSPCSYCQASASDTRFGHIDRVRLNGTKLDMRSGPGDGSGYSDFTTGWSERDGKAAPNYHVQWADVQPRRDYRLDVYGADLKPARDAYFSVYIDWNQDGRFDGPGERVAYGSGRSFATANIVVPATANLGSTRMRVILGQGRFPEPCEVRTLSGEVEDYTINILPP